MFEVHSSNEYGRTSPYVALPLRLLLVHLQPAPRRLRVGAIPLCFSAIVAFFDVVCSEKKCGDDDGSEKVHNDSLNTIIGVCSCMADESRFCATGIGWSATVLAATMFKVAEEAGYLLENAGANKTAGFW